MKAWTNFCKRSQYFASSANIATAFTKADHRKIIFLFIMDQVFLMTMWVGRIAECRGLIVKYSGTSSRYIAPFRMFMIHEISWAPVSPQNTDVSPYGYQSWCLWSSFVAIKLELLKKNAAWYGIFIQKNVFYLPLILRSVTYGYGLSIKCFYVGKQK